ncbi:MAG: LamG domain-containing protein [Planctomycetes bacterium]|nr:LamG domain-containing protein [Planctomycetota bacterium]
MSKKLIYMVSFVLVLSIALTGTARAELVGWWRFDDGSGTVAADSSASGNDGNFQGEPQWVGGQFGLALEMDGDDWVDCGDILDIADQISITCWVNPAGLEGDNGWVARWDVYAFKSSGTSLRFTTPGILDYTANNTTLVVGEWQHVAVTFVPDQAEGAIFYLNGVEAQRMNSTAMAAGGGPFGIGNNRWTQFYEGMIDDVRVYDHILNEGEILGAMEGGEGWPYALGPTPKDGALHEDTWINISWRAGDYAVSHDVYLGDNFDDVDAGAESTFQGNQADTFLVAGFPGFAYPDGLVPGTTYYWRIDEVNNAEPNSPWKGDIWSFSIPPKTAYFPDPADGGESVGVDVTLSWTAGFGAKLHTPYFGENFNEVDSAAGGMVQGTTAYTPGTLKMAKTYYWRVDEFDVVETHKGDVWSFTTEGAVVALDPANGAADVTQTPVLTWAPGLGASHEIYFGADEASLELKSSGNLGSESYDPGQLEWDTTYYWRVDEANSANADSPWTGPLWSFTTANFLIIDDMESYNDLDEGEPGSNRIYLAWADGFDNPAVNGSTVGNLNPPFAEQSIVNSGLQSMPMAYDNAVGKSEATLTLTSNKDWTVNGVTTLTIWYRGASANTAETLYVALNGNARVDNDDPDAALATRWTEWNIDLQAFADQGVNLANVNSITLGLSSVTGGTGIMYFDDIRLYPSAQ